MGQGFGKGLFLGGARGFLENHVEALLTQTWLCSWNLGSNPAHGSYRSFNHFEPQFPHL